MADVTAADTPSLDALRLCVHCGICVPKCPTYRVLGEEMDSPRGRVYLMRAAAEGRVEPTETFARHLDLCLGCRACETACPSGVPFGSLLEATRAQLRQKGRGRRGLRERLLYAFFPEPRRMGLLFAALRLYQRSGLQRLVRQSGILHSRLAALDEMLPVLPRAERLAATIPAHGRARGRVGLLTGCVQRHLYPGVNADTARLLALAGYDVVVPEAQGCCGALDLHGGRTEQFRWRARALASVFPPDLDFVVVNAAGCGSAMKEYGHWLDELAVTALATRTRDVTEVLFGADLPLAPLDITVAYADACHLVHGQRLREQPRALLRRIPGLVLVELGDTELCCGSAGVYNLVEPEVADRLRDMKVSRIAESGARVVATGNPGCMLQIANGCRARGLDVEVVHPVQLLARSAAWASREG
jgi:glycolate oxidase iron-sulfur subunit